MRQLGQAVAGTLLIALAQGCATLSEKPGKGEPLVDIPLYTLDGQRTSLLDMARGKVAVFKFGATWCTWCTRQIPHMNEVARRYPRETVAVFDIDLQENAGRVRAYAQKHGAAYPTLLDPRATGAVLYNITGIPVTIIAGPDQTIAYRGQYTTFKQMDRVIAPLVEKLQAERKR